LGNGEGSTGRKAAQAWKVDPFMVAKDVRPSATMMLDSLKFCHPRFVMTDPMFRGLGKTFNPTDVWIASMLFKYPGSLKPVFGSSHKLIAIWEIDYSKIVELQPGVEQPKAQSFVPEVRARTNLL